MLWVIYTTRDISQRQVQQICVSTHPLGLLLTPHHLERYKSEIIEQTIPSNSILALTPKSYFDKTEYEEKGNGMVATLAWTYC
jgi:hypothetical protein